MTDEPTDTAPATDTEPQPKRRDRSKEAPSQRARRQARIAAGLCPYCAKPNGRAPGEPGTPACPECRAKAQEHDRRNREQQREKRRQYAAAAKARAAARPAIAPLAADAPPPEKPYCPHCLGRDLARGGFIKGRQRYRCRTCARSSYGEPNPAPEPLPCPNPGCGGRCVRLGFSKKTRKQRYICRKCRRTNLRLWPTENRSPGGPFRHHLTLYLSLIADNYLEDYCQRHFLSRPQAVRDIFRRWADEPLLNLPEMRRDLDGWVAVPPRGPAEPREPIPDRLPDLRPEAARRRLAQGNGDHSFRNVLVVARMPIVLDDTAFQGLLRYMRRTGLNHQDAARALITAAGRALRTD
jgi:transposase-like protein